MSVLNTKPLHWLYRYFKSLLLPNNITHIRAMNRLTARVIIKKTFERVVRTSASEDVPPAEGKR